MKEVIVPADDLVCIGKEKLQEVIRCKDCIYAVDEYGDNECYCRNRLNGTYLMYIKDWDHYCSWAERKEENE